MPKPQMPEWAMHPDPSYVDMLERLRRRYAWHLDCKPIFLNEGTAWAEPLTVDVALAWAERLATEELG